MISSEVKIGLAFAAAMSLGIAYFAAESKRTEVKKAQALAAAKQKELERTQLETQYPPEYWEAKKVEQAEKTKRHQMDVESAERMKLDQRARDEEQQKARMEFEKNAPAEYWAAQKAAEEEKTRRHQMDLEDARYRRQTEAERDIAKKHAEALEQTAKAFERGMRHAPVSSSGVGYLSI